MTSDSVLVAVSPDVGSVGGVKLWVDCVAVWPKTVQLSSPKNLRHGE